ncbi:MAG: nicotinate (nicotinamide) nucleotide adenylyltransferase [Oscillospiraceae bacterium]|nr:nicotinate (nicotinamide) nucleotide adenylyltransferase [Oscillospiraceae bacterium]
MKIGVYGGTFNPPHLGHLISARFAMDALGLDKLIFVPAAVPPHKELPEGSPSAEKRLEMMAIAADTLLLPGKVEVSDMELRREGKSYTADTLRQLRGQYPQDELWLLMGADMFLSLPNWREPETICALAHLAAFARKEGDTEEALERQGSYLSRTYGAKTRVVQLPRITPVSSTQLRELLKRGEGQRYLPLAVYGYILRHGLYGVQADLTALSNEDLRACSLSMVYAKRHAHILGVEEEAVRLAKRWGADQELARRGGILHDCTKYLSLEEHLAICEKYGIVPDELERESPKLLHSKTGAALARNLYGQNDEIYWAIYWHTTGKADMSLLEKIIYLADYIEPNRDFEGVEEMRRLCYEDLDAGLLMGLEMSVEDLNERGVPIHKNTRGALEWLREHRKG